MQQKLCKKCGIEKPTSEFYNRKTTRITCCKGCALSYRQTDTGRATQARANAKYQAKPEVKLAQRLRDRLRMATRNIQKAGSAVRDLGCNIDEFRAYIETRFQPGMTWENWTHDGWHLDHIQPLASFDLSNREQFLMAGHYTNLQPMWARDNFSKGSKKKKPLSS
jgi:hypothetical protein